MATGTHTADRLTLARLPSGVPVETTIHRYEGARDGPALYVQAAQHGREVNGTETLRRLHERLPIDRLSGTLLVVPVANPLTFDRVSYTAPEPLDSVNSNMNRVWPGDAGGTLHERMAATLWEYAGSADAIVDLHTGSPDMLPHVVFREGDAESRRLADAFGTDLLLAEEADEDAGAEWTRRRFGGKLRVAASREGIPSITPELAHNKQLVEHAIETGIDGLLSVLGELGMLEDAPRADGERVLARNHLGRVVASDSGLFHARPALAVGDRIAEGTPLGTLYDPATYEVLQEPVADRDGILYSLTREATVTGGEKLANVAFRSD